MTPPADVNVAGETAGGRLGELPPTDVIAAAYKVGQWFADRSVKGWQLGPCADRFQPQPPAPASRSGDAGGERAKFEAWITSTGRGHMLERNSPNGWYIDLNVTAWWAGWQAAIAASHAPDATLAATSGATSAAKVELERDAARYRWLRHGDNDERVIQRGPVDMTYHWLPRNERLDAMIDAQMGVS